MRALLRVAALLVAALPVVGCGVQPTEPIGGSPATGAVLYLVRDDTAVPVLRATGRPPTGAQALALLAGGPNAEEQAEGLSSRVPRTDVPITLDGTTITVPADVAALPDLAVTQIVCTSASPGPVTLTGGGHRRGPLTCPL
ncbi:hypothetical protein AB0I60_12605 [Actinosynnema sp. NPDC050436]|uniref:hypothetical protein n=1 Tax=Actinosynnema sp. NPDC050436 TaxID=3155659 RepID=UPI0033F44DDE